MRILPSWSTVMNENVGSTVGLTTVDVEAVRLVDRLPVVRRAAPPSGSTPSFSPAARIASMSMTFAQIVDVGRRRNRPGACVARLERRCEAACASRRRCSAQSSSLARSWIHVGDVGVGRAAVGRVVLEAAVARADCATA